MAQIMQQHFEKTKRKIVLVGVDRVGKTTQVIEFDNRLLTYFAEQIIGDIKKHG